jgi:hypothetical protein
MRETPPLRKRTLMKEAMTALLAVALLFLNFAHQAPAIAYSADLTPYLLADGASAPLCEKHPGDHAAHETTCHLCRLGAGLDLPPPPCTALAAPLVAGNVTYRNTGTAPVIRAASPASGARAPPVPVTSA